MIKHIVPSILLVLLVGCSDNFEMQETGGKLYRLNKKTGSVDIIEGHSITQLQLKSSPNVNYDSIAIMCGAVGVEGYSEQKIDSLRNKYAVSKKMTAKDSEAMGWAIANPNDPRANKIFAVLGIDTTGIYHYIGGNLADSASWKPSILTDEKITWYEKEVNSGKFISPWKRYRVSKDTIVSKKGNKYYIGE